MSSYVKIYLKACIKLYPVSKAVVLKKKSFHNFCLQVEVSPLENAIEVIENKNLQLRTLITQCQSRQMQNINPLTMCLNGVIDAAVNGGLARYQEVRTRSAAGRVGGEVFRHRGSRNTDI